MGSMTNAFETALLKHVVNQQAWTPPATLHAGLLTAITDAEAGTVTECVDTGYARQPVTWATVANGATDNGAVLQWPSAGSGYTVVGLGLWDAASGGNLLFVDDVTSTVLAAGDRYEIALGSLDLSFD